MTIDHPGPPPDVPGWLVRSAADGVLVEHDSMRGPVELTPRIAIGLGCQLLHRAAVVERQREMRSNRGPGATDTGETR